MDYSEYHIIGAGSLVHTTPDGFGRFSLRYLRGTVTLDDDPAYSRLETPANNRGIADALPAAFSLAIMGVQNCCQRTETLNSINQRL